MLTMESLANPWLSITWYQDFKYYIYSDDSQICISIPDLSLIIYIQVSTWYLHLNTKWTSQRKYIQNRTLDFFPLQIYSIPNPPFLVHGPTIHSVAQNLGVILDSSLSLTVYIQNVRKSC